MLKARAGSMAGQQVLARRCGAGPGVLSWFYRGRTPNIFLLYCDFFSLSSFASIASAAPPLAGGYHKLTVLVLVLLVQMGMLRRLARAIEAHAHEVRTKEGDAEGGRMDRRGAQRHRREGGRRNVAH